jgi:hypothetical protein
MVYPADSMRRVESMTGMADEATFVFANRTAVYWAEPTSERPSDAAGE